MIDAINFNEDALNELPVALKTQFNKDYQQLSDNNEKLKTTHEQIVKAKEQRDKLNESISSLNAQIKDLDGITKELAALDELRTKLSSELATNSDRLSEYNSTITVIKNAMGSLSNKPDIVEIIESTNGVSFEKLNMTSFADIQKWFDMMEKSLRQGIEIYTEAYSILLEKVGYATNQMSKE